MVKNPKEIKLKEKIKYILFSDSLGRAEFHFCPVFKYGYLRKLFIFRIQQENQESYCLDLRKELRNWKINFFHITSWTHKTNMPHVWQNFWCKEHKTICFDVYPPDNTDTIEFDAHFGNSLTIRFVSGD